MTHREFNPGSIYNIGFNVRERHQSKTNQDNGLNRMRFEASTESGKVGFAEVDTSVALGRG